MRAPQGQVSEIFVRHPPLPKEEQMASWDRPAPNRTRVGTRHTPSRLSDYPLVKELGLLVRRTAGRCSPHKFTANVASNFRYRRREPTSPPPGEGESYRPPRPCQGVGTTFPRDRCRSPCACLRASGLIQWMQSLSPAGWREKLGSLLKSLQRLESWVPQLKSPRPTLAERAGLA